MTTPSVPVEPMTWPPTGQTDSDTTTPLPPYSDEELFQLNLDWPEDSGLGAIGPMTEATRRRVRRFLATIDSLTTRLSAAEEVVKAAQDLTALWQTQKIAGLPRSERNAAIEGARSELIEKVDAYDATKGEKDNAD